MTPERIEYHPPKKPARRQRIARAIATGGFSELSDQPPLLSDEERTEREAKGYDPTKVQQIVDWVQSQEGIHGEKVAATLRGAINDLVRQVDESEVARDD
jgi:hypothetical protein